MQDAVPALFREQYQPRTGTAHVVTTRRIYNGKVYQTLLLRRSYREGGTVKRETLGNLSHMHESLIEIIRRALRGETFR